MDIVRLLDVLVIAMSALSAWLWLAATRTTLRRIDYAEELNAADLNRLVVNINRSQILNRRAALATGAALTLNAARYLAELTV